MRRLWKNSNSDNSVSEKTTEEFLYHFQKDAFGRSLISVSFYAEDYGSAAHISPPEWRLTQGHTAKSNCWLAG
jgi:hypothetical protein